MLASSLLGVCLTTFLINPQVTHPGNGAAYSGLDLPTSINNKQSPTNMLSGQPETPFSDNARLYQVDS